MSESNPGRINQKSQTFSCPSCGGRMIFDPESQNLKCPYCDSQKPFSVSQRTPNEYDIRYAPPVQDNAWGDDTHTVRCNGCGAQIVLTGETTADFCPFCGAPHVLEGQSKSGIAPESLIPFKITKPVAVEAFRKWLKKKLFAPYKAKRMAVLGQITGLYLPHWTYDASSVSHYSGRAGHYYYVTVQRVVTGPDGKRRTQNVQEQRIRWSPASGVVSNDFDDILVVGSERLPAKMLSSVQPFDLSRLVQYTPEFISGFGCEKPVVDVQQGWEKAQRIIDREMTRLAERDILTHADVAEVTHLSTENTDVRYKLLLLPMYLSAFTYKKKLYHVLVNGQTGKANGKSPISPWRVLVAVLMGLAVLAGVLYLYMKHQNSQIDMNEYHFYFSMVKNYLLG